MVILQSSSLDVRNFVDVWRNSLATYAHPRTVDQVSYGIKASLRGGEGERGKGVGDCMSRSIIHVHFRAKLEKFTFRGGKWTGHVLVEGDDSPTIEQNGCNCCIDLAQNPTWLDLPV